MLLIQFLVVLAAIIIGARLGGIGLGVMGGVGLLILTFVFGLQPTTPPVDVMLMIAAVISAASCMQAAGGLEYMVKLAERILRKNPSRVTILSPLVTYLFTFVAGTGHIAYSVLPVIAEVARETRIRPERPLGIAVIASQQAITASPISAATVALLGLLSGAHFSLFDILKISVPATLAGVLVGAFCSLKVGKELMDDPEYQRRLKEGTVENTAVETTEIPCMWKARWSVALFLIATFLIVLFAWMGDTFINGNLAQLTGSIEHIVQEMPWLFGVALFVMSILLYSQAATVRAVMPLGLALGISPALLVALFPAVNGYFFIPNYPTVVAAINFDRTGTTRIGKYVLNHSFMMPGMVATIVSIVVGMLLIQVLL